MSHNWHYTKGGERHGPITAADLKHLTKTGQLSPDDLVWREDTKDWKKAGSIKGLFPSPVVQPQTTLSPPPLPPTTKQAGDVPLFTPKRLILAFVLFPLVIVMLLPIVQRARDAARKSQAERQGDRADQEIGQNNVALGGTKTDVMPTKPVEIGTLEELGEAAYENLPFADVEDSPDAGPIALTEEFAMSGTFRFRDIHHDTIKATLTAEEIRVLNYKEKNEVWEVTKTFDITEGTGNPKVMVEHHRNDKVPLYFPIIRVGATPGDEWECVNLDITGNSMITRFRYQRCVEHEGTRCAKIERSFMSPDEKQVTRTYEWYAEGIGLVMKVDFLPSHHLGLGWQLMSTDHRIIGK